MYWPRPPRAQPAGRSRSASRSSTILVWLVTGPLFGFSDTWQLVINTGTTIVTFLMVFLIQNTQNRDAEAMQVKLDELIRVTAGAHNALLDLEELEEHELDASATRYEQLARARPRGAAPGPNGHRRARPGLSEPGATAARSRPSCRGSPSASSKLAAELLEDRVGDRPQHLLDVVRAVDARRAAARPGSTGSGPRARDHVADHAARQRAPALRAACTCGGVAPV